MQGFFADNIMAELWMHVGGNQPMKEVVVPFLLALPQILLHFMVSKGGQCMPHKLLGGIE